MSKVRLVYFDVDGLGEPIRMALTQCGIEWEDHRFKERSEFQAMKPSLRFGQVPCLQVNGEEIVQSASILRYIGSALDSDRTLYPADPAVAARVDALMDQTKDATMGRMVFKYTERFWGSAAATVLPEDKAATVEKAWVAEVLPRHLAFYEDVLEKSPTQWLAGTASPTIADFLAAAVFNSLRNSNVEFPPAMLAWVSAVYNLPAVKANKAREQLAKA